MKLTGALLLAAILLVSPLRSANGQTSPPDTAAPPASPATSSSVRVIVNGQEISAAAPPIAHGGQVMAPLPGLFEPFGATAVWLAQEQAVVITHRPRLVIRLKVNEPYASIGEQKRLLPIAPVLLRGIPFIPVQAVFGLLGAWAKLDEAEGALYVTSVVNNVTVQRAGGPVRVNVDATGPVHAETRRLSDPERVVIDLRNAVFRQRDLEAQVNDDAVARMRVAQFQTKPFITRIVLDLLQPVDVRVAEEATSFKLSIEIKRAPASTAGGPSSAPASAPPPPPSGARSPAAQPPSRPPEGENGADVAAVRVLNVRVDQGSGATRVLVEGSGPMRYAARELIDPDRLVVDILDAVFVPVRMEIAVGTPAVDNVRAAQFQTGPDVTRVVVTLKRKSTFSISSADGDALVIAVADNPLGGHVVVLDAGHGGRDPGAIGPTGLMEKQVTLDIVFRVRQLLADEGFRVVLTRETDVFVELSDRIRMARELGGTVFVSIHANASARTAANGTETYYASAHGLTLAQMIQDELGKTLGMTSRGVKFGNFLVLRENTMPAALVELAFISHPQEEARLREDAFRQRLAGAVARGIGRFLAIYPVPAGH